MLRSVMGDCCLQLPCRPGPSLPTLAHLSLHSLAPRDAECGFLATRPVAAHLLQYAVHKPQLGLVRAEVLEQAKVSERRGEVGRADTPCSLLVHLGKRLQLSRP